MNFWKWLESGAQKSVEDGGNEDVAKHMERYHPDGFNPKTDHCILVERDKGIDGVSLGEAPCGNDSPHYYERYSKGVSLTEMEEWIRENCGGHTKCVFVREEKDFEKNGISRKINPNFVGFGEFPSRDDYEGSCKRFFEIAKDLKKRHEDIPIDVDWYIPFNFTKKKLGSSTLDRRQNLSYIGVLAYPENIQRLGFHERANYEDLIYDITRHEIGHNLSTYDVLEEAIDSIDSLRERVGSRKLFHVLYEKVSPYASFQESNLVMGNYGRVSKEYAEEMEETIAEIFSAYTAPSYHEGTMPPELERIAKKMLMPQDQGEGEKTTMDSNDEEELTYAQKHPEEWEEFIKYNSIQYQHGPTKYGYWDRHTDKWVAMAEDSLWARMMRAAEENDMEELDRVFAVCEKQQKEREKK